MNNNRYFKIEKHITTSGEKWFKTYGATSILAYIFGGWELIATCNYEPTAINRLAEYKKNSSTSRKIIHRSKI